MGVAMEIAGTVCCFTGRSQGRACESDRRLSRGSAHAGRCSGGHRIDAARDGGHHGVLCLPLEDENEAEENEVRP